VKMVSIGKGDVGASKLTGEVLDVMERLPKSVEGLTGVDITKVCTLALCYVKMSEVPNYRSTRHSTYIR